MSKMQTPPITLWFPEKCLFRFFILEKQLSSQNMFLVRSKLSITAYFFLVLYKTTSLQSRLFLEYIWRPNCSIPSMHTERKINVHSHKHSFTPYPSRSPYRWTERWIHSLRVGWRNFFFSCAVVSVFGSGGK